MDTTERDTDDTLATTTGTGAIGGAVAGGAFGAAVGGPAGAIGGVVLGIILGDELEKISIERQSREGLHLAQSLRDDPDANLIEYEKIRSGLLNSVELKVSYEIDNKENEDKS